jgi:hypothetical protein
LSTDHINKKGKIIFIVSDNFSDNEGFISIEKFEFQFQFSRFFPSDKRDFYTFDSSDEKIIQKISDKGIGGDEGVNIEENIEEDIKEIVEQIIKKIVEEINMEEDIRDLPKFRRNGRDRKQIKKFSTYYHNFHKMKDKRSEYEEEYRV